MAEVKSAAIFLGPAGMGPWESLELRTFIEECIQHKLPVIPVLLPGVTELPRDFPFLKQLQSVRLGAPDDTEGLDHLIWGITGKKLL